MYLGHNASMTIAIDDKILEVVEFERMTNIKNGGCMAQIGVKDPKVIITIVKDYLMNKYSVKRFDLLLMNHHDLVCFRRGIFLSEKEISFNYAKAKFINILPLGKGAFSQVF